MALKESSNTETDIMITGKMDLAEWQAYRLIDERSGNSCIGIGFPRRQGGRDFEVVDEDLTERPERVRDQLKKRGASFAGTKAEQITFVRDLLQGLAATPLVLAMKAGLREKDGFVLGRRMIGTAVGRYCWKAQSGLSLGEIGDRSGTLADWNKTVGRICTESVPLTFGICLALGSVLPSYVRANSGRRLLSETASFNLSGQSGSGKTSVVRAAAAVSGPPDLLHKCDFTRRGLEEYAESRNDLLACLEDWETHSEESMLLRTAMQHVNQILPSGQSKLMSSHPGLPAMSWTTFGLTSSPEPLDEIAERINWRRTDGQRVRYLDIPIPPVDQAGIFTELKGDSLDRVQQGKVLIQELDVGLSSNYGVLLPQFLRWLLEEDRSDRIVRNIDRFLNRVAANGDGFDERYARKFAVPAVAGFLAAKLRIMLWPKEWPFQAVERCYHLAIAAVRSDAQRTHKKLKLLARLSADVKRFTMTPSGASIQFTDKTLGLCSAPRRRVSPVEEDSTQRVVD